MGPDVSGQRWQPRLKKREPLRGCRAQGMVRAVGKHDSRNSMKMKRRKAQAKKKARLKRRSKERKVPVGQAKKAPARRAPKAAPVAAPAPPSESP